LATGPLEKIVIKFPPQKMIMVMLDFASPTKISVVFFGGEKWGGKWGETDNIKNHKRLKISIKNISHPIYFLGWPHKVISEGRIGRIQL
jgi:hypothetical protein